MIRASSTPTTRTVDKLLLGGKPAAEQCGCDSSLELQRRINAAQPFLVSVIEKLAEIASSPESSSGVALTDARRALSALESEE